MSKQTAVEWLVEQLLANGDIRWRGTSIFDLSEQAKAMEREQIIEAYYGQSHSTSVSNGEQYYNETYKGGEQ